MALVAAMPVRAAARLVKEHDTRLWRIVHHWVEAARARADLASVKRVAIAVGAGDASHAGVQEGLMLEEIEVPPLLHGGVVHGTVSRAALRAWEAAAPGEVDLNIEPTLRGIERAGLDHPRRNQPEGQLHQIGVAHRG